MHTYPNLSQQIEDACRSIAPLWPLTHFVAVNPFLGYSSRPIWEASLHQKQVHGDYPIPGIEWLKEQFSNGSLGTEHLEQAINSAPAVCREAFASRGLELDAASLLQLSDARYASSEAEFQLGAFSVYLDRRDGSAWNHLIRQEAAKWCAAHFDKGQSTWRSPWVHLSFYEAWKESVRRDFSLELGGIKGAKTFVAELPENPLEAIRSSLGLLQVPEERSSDILERVMLELSGWSGYMRYLDRENQLRGEESDHGLQLIAVLMSYEAILYQYFKHDHNRVLGWRRSLQEDLCDTGEQAIPIDLALRLVWLSALEHSVESDLRTKIHTLDTSECGPWELQAAFCIDVRSERLRRALESVMPTAQTKGFAGFFGIPANHEVPGRPSRRALCPALLAPPIKTQAAPRDSDPADWIALEANAVRSTDKRRAWRSFRESAASCFTFVETLGLGYVSKLVRDAFGLSSQRLGEASSAARFSEAMDYKKKVDLAEGILRGINQCSDFAPVVLFCGHGGQSANNPYASGLDCGACGGHAGDANAKLAATLLNDASVRSGLRKRGIAIPDQTKFIAGIHNTTTDEITLFETETLQAKNPKLLSKIRSSLNQAADLCLLQRSAGLGLSESEKRVGLQVRQRSRDWSQVRPEWGLAGNSSFIVAPRAWTKGQDLGGASFLHEYNPLADAEGKQLEGILAGPLVVGSWINLQYFGSSVNNEVYGSGHKTIHNVVGGIGVALGNEYDLRPGLPLQSVHDGKRLVHRPSRLLACIAAEPEVVDSILERQKHLGELVTNGWIHMVALGAKGDRWLKKGESGAWSESDGPQVETFKRTA